MKQTYLKERSFKRNAGVWRNWDVQGLAAELSDIEDLTNQANKNVFSQGVAIIDGMAKFQTEQRNKLHDLEMYEVEQDRQLAYDKYLAQQQELAYRIAGENYLLSAREFDVVVKSFIMEAKEYAAEIEREATRLQKSRAQMDIYRSEVQVEQTQARILTEYYERANVKVEIARSKLKVAEANIRVIMSEIEAKRTQLKILEGDLTIAMTEAEKSALIAEIASILADIIVRGLAAIALDVETKEIEEAYIFVQQKLSDMLEIWEKRIDVQDIIAYFEALLQKQVEIGIVKGKESEDIKKKEVQSSDRTFVHEKGLTEDYREEETDLRNDTYIEREALAWAKANGNVEIMYKNLECQALINRARQALNELSTIHEVTISKLKQTISKG